ncbi:protein FAR1-RELATED SEQUENCE 1-like [Silene latifolia]|uniref:protein FAR1-RELATED SEQUENCE 1-like n=1 Tax=Silene latifolia TaxID=37657 RepID=UPI003D778A7D
MSNSFDLNALYIEEEGENEVIDENETATELLRHATCSKAMKTINQLLSLRLVRNLNRSESDFYYAVERDADNKLLNIFWSDARCRAMYKAFGDPSSFDSTFLSNRDLRTLVHESITEEELQDMWDDFMEKYNLRCNKWLRGAWDMRQRWMPVFWKDTFCAGMSSTQRSEQTNRFIKTYMSIETGLMQFMEQYEDAIEKKVEDEKVNNAKDIKSPLKWDPMILFEDIFSKVYTNKKFGEVKTEVYGCISTNVETLPNSLGFIKRFRATSKVTEAFWKKDRRSFEVSIDTITGEYKCDCKMFEFRGILCRHIMKCLDVLDVKAIPHKYIIERWRKDLVRGYENIRVGYYNPDESERVKRSLEITVKNDYIKRLAMQSEGSSAIYNSEPMN